MVLCLTHRTAYVYGTPACDSHNEVRLKPLTDQFQTCLSYELRTEPGARIFEYDEPGGTVNHFSHRYGHLSLDIVAESVVGTTLTNPYADLNLIEDDWAGLIEASRDHVELLSPTLYVPIHSETTEIARQLPRNASVAAYLITLCRHIHETIEYRSNVTNVYSAIEDVLRHRAGVCQDFAHVFLACARSLGIPSRYVSGYLYVASNESMRGDHASHAWVECLLPDGRWLQLDPTNNILANERYIRIHTGRDYSEVAPTRGVYVGTPATELKVSVRVVQAETAISG